MSEELNARLRAIHFRLYRLLFDDPAKLTPEGREIYELLSALDGCPEKRTVDTLGPI